MSKNIKYIEELEGRLIKAEQKENRLNGFAGILNFILCSGALLLLIAVVELVWNLSSPARTILAVIFFAVLLFLFIYFMIVPLFIKRNKHTSAEHIQTAEKTGRYFEQIKDELKNVLQIAYENHSGYSGELVNAALKNAADKYAGLDFSEAVNIKPLYKKAKIVTVAAMFAILIFVTVQPMQSALYRIINFNKDFSLPPKYVFSVKPGDCTLTKGEDAEITVKASDNNLAEISLFIKSQEDADFREKRLAKNSEGGFDTKLINVQNSFSYFVSAEDVKSRIYNVTLVGRPVINGFELKITPPSYSNLPEEIMSDNGNVTALYGTKINFTINSSKELKSAFIEFSDSLKAELKADGKKARGEILIKKDVTYHFRLEDKENNFNTNPAEYEIKTVSDAYPSIQILSPEKNYNVSAIKTVNVISKISDDFGFSKMNLYFRISEAKYVKTKESFTGLSIPLKSNSKEQEVYYLWDIAPLSLAEGEAVSYYVEVLDNDNISGPKAAKSDLYVLRVPTLDDLYDKSGKEEQSLEKEMKDVLEESKKLKEEFDKNVNEIKKNKRELSWEEKNNISKNLDDLEKVESKIDNIKEKLTSMQKELSRNNLLSKETMDKYAELQNLFSELNNEELKQALQKLQEALKSMMRDNTRQSLDKLNQDEEYLKNSIERTLNLLKRIRVEQKIDELIKRVQNLNEKTAELTKKIQNGNLNDKESNNELSARQEDITDGLKQLDSEMKKANEMMKNLEDMPEDEMKKVMAEYQKQKNENISQGAESAIKQFRKDNAMQNEQMLSKNLSSSASLLSSMKTSFLQKNQMKSVKSMMKAMENIISLSKDQEKLRIESEGLQYNSDRLKDKLRTQNELKNNLLKIIQQITGLSQKTFGITPEMGKALGKSLYNMQNAVIGLQNSGGAAVPSQKGAMEGLNQAASLLKGSMDKMMGGGQGGGMMSLMQQMEQLSMQQMSLNKLTGQLNKGALSMEEQAQLQRLAGQQETIRKSLEKLNREAKEAGQSKSLAANLDKTLEEMKSVVKELSGNKIDNNIIKQQERILSRMLDSQLSLNEKDFEKNRESKSGARFDMTSPDKLNLKDNSRSKLKDELMKADREGYKKDYEELIRRYFEALEKKKNIK